MALLRGMAIGGHIPVEEPPKQESVENELELIAIEYSQHGPELYAKIWVPKGQTAMPMPFGTICRTHRTTKDGVPVFITAARVTPSMFGSTSPLPLSTGFQFFQGGIMTTSPFPVGGFSTGDW